MSGKRNIGRTMTVLIMFVLTVVIVLVIFSYFSGLITFGNTGPHNVDFSGVFSLNPQDSSSGTLAFTLTNLSQSPVVLVTFSCPTSDFASASCNGMGVENIAGPISTNNPVKTNANAGGTALVTLARGVNLTPGASSVTVTANVTFQDGTVKSFSVYLPTQE